MRYLYWRVLWAVYVRGGRLIDRLTLRGQRERWGGHVLYRMGVEDRRRRA